MAMKWADIRICKYYESVSASASASWAVDMLATLNSCTADEIVAILQKHGYAKNFYQKKEKKEVVNPNKAAIIKDYESGMTCKEIGERYGMNPHAVYNSLWSWSQKGLVAMRKETPAKADKPVHKPKTKKEPAPSANDTSSTPIKNKSVEIIPPKTENVNREDMVNWLSHLIDIAQERIGSIYDTGHGYSGGFEVSAARAENDKGKAAVEFKADGKTYALVLEVRE